MSTADKLTTIAENVPKVYEAGKKAEYDAFWDKFQQNGERKNYNNGFSGIYWDANTLKPKYNVTPTAAYMMFYNIRSDANIDLVKIEEDCGMKFDFSKCTDFMYAFYTTGLVRIGVLDTRAANGFGQFAAGNSTLHTIEKLILREDGSQTFSPTWFFPYSLKNVTIEGKIGNTLNFGSNGQFTKESIISIINALSDTATGKTLTLIKSLVASRFGSVDNAEWQALVASKPNWTISLT